MNSSHGSWVWRKSSFSQGDGNSDCVEVAWALSVTAMRDSKNPNGGMLMIPESAWRAFRVSVSD